MADLAWWQALVSGAVGGATSLAGQGLAAHWSTQAAREARDALQAEQKTYRRDAFELESLAQLRMAIANLAAATNPYREAVVAELEVGGPEAGDTPAGRAFDDAMSAFQAARHVVLDARVREALDAYRAALHEFLHAPRPAGKKQTEVSLQKAAAELVIGERIRAIYGPGPADRQ